MPPADDDEFYLASLFVEDDPKNERKSSLRPLRHARLSLLKTENGLPSQDTKNPVEIEPSKEDDKKSSDGFNYFRLQPTATQVRRNRMRMEQKLSQKKTRDEKVAKLRKIELVLSDSDNEDYKDKELFGDASDGQAVEQVLKKKEEEEKKIPSKVGKNLRKKVNKLSDVLDNCLSLV